MPERPLVYIAHPLGAGPDRDENLRKATWWCAWAADQGVIPCAPWIAIATHWPETRRDEGLAIDLATISRCDEVWLCGPRVSPGMLIEASFAHEKAFKEIRRVTDTGVLISINPWRREP